MAQPLLDFTADINALVIAPSRYPQAKQTSALAAVANQGKRATQNETIVRLLTAAGDRGLSDGELERLTGYGRSTICARRGWDLASLIEPADTRETETGRTPKQRWRLRREDER